MGGEPGDRGSASLWVVAGGTLVLLVALVAVLRGSAVLAREQAEVAADLAALAAADRIGIDSSSTGVCARATRIAAANQARLVGCAVRLGADGRTGTVDVTVSARVRLAAVGATVVHARARAGRLAWGVTGPDDRPGPTGIQPHVSSLVSAAPVRSAPVRSSPVRSAPVRSLAASRSAR